MGAWVIQNAPISCMTPKVARFLGSVIGEIEEIDLGGTCNCLGTFMRVGVKFDVTKPECIENEDRRFMEELDMENRSVWQHRNKAGQTKKWKCVLRTPISNSLLVSCTSNLGLHCFSPKKASLKSAKNPSSSRKSCFLSKMDVNV
ncbi:hypothetical protein PanWU01x14_111090 [Parasponia andersonii]|uniref:Uncharacterized protein n=1 Tax=Parasponia andersonii TaxID=3476 RepID=A0A2P5CYX8_PARAD|nr:hypothetical protein PanWU01x14_111090 [Parasponia andersonii]